MALSIEEAWLSRPGDDYNPEDEVIPEPKPPAVFYRAHNNTARGIGTGVGWRERQAQQEAAEQLKAEQLKAETTRQRREIETFWDAIVANFTAPGTFRRPMGYVQPHQAVGVDTPPPPFVFSPAYGVMRAYDGGGPGF